MSLNKVMLIGRLGQDAELKTTPNGASYLVFSLATSETWKDKATGEKKEKTEWHRCKLWGDRAKSLAQYMVKGMMPAVFYGSGKETTPIAVSLVEFEKVWRKAGESTPIILSTDNGEVSTLIHEVQFHPVKGTPLHADFLVVDMNKDVEVSVPLEFTGEAPAAKSGLGTLTKVLHEVTVRALPNDLPHSIMVDISVLETLENQIHVSDLVAPKGVTIVTEGHEVVALVAAQKEETESAPVDLSSIEVEQKGKKEEENTEA